MGMASSNLTTARMLSRVKRCRSATPGRIKACDHTDSTRTTTTYFCSTVTFTILPVKALGTLCTLHGELRGQVVLRSTTGRAGGSSITFLSAPPQKTDLMPPVWPLPRQKTLGAAARIFMMLIIEHETHHPQLGARGVAPFHSDRQFGDRPGGGAD